MRIRFGWVSPAATRASRDHSPEAIDALLSGVRARMKLEPDAEITLEANPGTMEAARYRGFHRYDLTTCFACDQCAKACPVDCIYIGKERVENGKGFKITGYTIDYTKCMFCALCVEPCPVDCIFMGATHDLSCYSRDGCIVDFSRLPLDVAWGRATLNPTAVADSKVITEPVHGGPNQ
jgi:NADH-quinone oxidoreductase subunit I